MKMMIAYRDELGIVVEEIDEYGISFCDGKAYVNDKSINVDAIIAINKE